LIGGIDVRKSGSGNIGATNVLRVLGKRYGYSVFVLDFLKGLGAVRIAMAIAMARGAESTSPEVIGVLAAVSAVIGHSFPIWLKFRGGKGVATSAGALFGLMPLATVIGAAIWMLTFLLTRYVSVASVTTAVALPFVIAMMTWINQTDEKALFYSSLCIAAVIIWRHHSNLCRLVRGTEPRFTRK
jgi:glycerol-3-phosphate acyltransferase PlsY